MNKIIFVFFTAYAMGCASAPHLTSKLIPKYRIGQHLKLVGFYGNCSATVINQADASTYLSDVLCPGGTTKPIYIQLADIKE